MFRVRMDIAWGLMVHHGRANLRSSPMHALTILQRCIAPLVASVQQREFRGPRIPGTGRKMGTVRPGKAACSSGWETRLGNREPRAQYRALRRDW